MNAIIVALINFHRSVRICARFGFNCRIGPLVVIDYNYTGLAFRPPFIAFELYIIGKILSIQLRFLSTRTTRIRVDLSKWNYIYIKFEVWKFRSIHVPRRGSTRSRSLDKRTAAKLCSLKQDFQKGKKNAPFFFKVCTRERNKKCCDSSVDDTVYIEYVTRANTRIVVLVHANSRMQVQRTVVVGRVVVTVVARCSRISRPKTRRWNCWRSEGRIGISSPLYSRIKSIFFEGNNTRFVAWKILSTTSYQRQPLLVLVNLIPSLAHPLAFVSFAVPEPRLHSSVPHHQMIFGCHENLEFLTRLFENSQLPPLGLISFYTSCSSSSPPHFVCSFQDFKNCHAERPMERACTRVSRTNLNIQKFILFPD